MAKQSEPVKPTIWNVYKIVAKLVFLGYIAKNFDFHLVLGNIENFSEAPISRDQAMAWLILPPPEQSCVESQLQAIFADPQGPLRLVVLDCHAHPANQDHSKEPAGQTAAGPPH
jgi:hypothetical protein